MTAWKYEVLGKLCKTGAGGTPLKAYNEYYENGDVNWLQSGEVNAKDILFVRNRITKLGLENSSAKVFPENTVLVAMYGATAGQVGILRIASATNQAVCGILPTSTYLPEFLYYYITFQKEYLLEQATGSAQPNISQIKIKNLPLPLLPLPVQKAIVAKLDAAFANIEQAIAAAEKNAENAKQLFQSYLSDVFDAAKLEGAAFTIGEVVDLTVGFAFKSTGYTNAENGVRLLRGDNIIQGAIRWDDAKYWPRAEIQKYEKYQLEIGDIVLAMDRPLIKSGLKRSVISDKDVPSLLLQRTARLRGKKIIKNRFLSCLISAPQFSTYINGLQTGLGVPHISGQQIKDFSIGVPNIEKQDETIIATQSALLNIDIATEAYLCKAAKLNELKQSLLQQAFNGQLVDA